MKTLNDELIYMGCDPEFFFSKKGAIIGAEKIIPKEGIKPTYSYSTQLHTYDKANIIIDGVQAELNPAPNTCRANLGNSIATCFTKLYSQIKEDKELEIDFSQVVEVSKEELESLSEKSRIFGCAPSTNIYDVFGSEIKVNPAIYRTRSAGGHIHLGEYRKLDNSSIALHKPERLVPILDAILGNTCVLFDRNELNKERRKVYGRAGEFRTPKYGLEYRTLSNFWLKNYRLMSMVMGIARMGVRIVASDIVEGSLEKEILSKVERDDIIKAINENDFDLAYKNFNKIEPTLLKISNSRYSCPIHDNTIKKFHTVIEKGINYYFKDDILKHWITLPEGHDRGWESFLEEEV